MRVISTLLSIIASTALAHALSLPAIISDNMLLQQNANANLWGKAKPGNKITIKSSWGATATATADSNGAWKTKLKTTKHGGPHTITFIADGDTTTINNILLGEVWLASGQSNMEFTINEFTADKGKENHNNDIIDDNLPSLRLFQVDKTLSLDSTRTDCKGRWVCANTANIKYFSAIGFMMGQELHKKLNTPVGIIESTWGGSPVESWTKKELMLNDTLYSDTFKRYTRESTEPKQWLHKIPASLWQSMITPILGYTVKGVAWYQGESNAPYHRKYAEMFCNMIKSWRKEWQPHLPFYYMQAAPHSTQNPRLRNAQYDVWQKQMVPDIEMATVIDCGDSLDLHPRNKRTPAHRLALWILNREYNFNIECQGPTALSAKALNGKITVKMSHASGMHIEGKKANDLWIAGENGEWHTANAEIKGNSIIISSPNVKCPKKVRYCQSPYCKGNIYNKANLPAYPFEFTVK